MREGKSFPSATESFRKKDLLFSFGYGLIRIFVREFFFGESGEVR